MRSRRYVPERGDLIWLDFEPVRGVEQAGRRPALALSPAAYNGRVGLGLFVPITSKAKGYPYEVALPEDLPVRGAVLADHVKSLDWRARRAEFIVPSPESVIDDVLAKIVTLLGSEG